MKQIKLTQKDKRTLGIGLIIAVAILLFHYGFSPALEQWRQVRKQIDRLQKQLAQLDLDRNPAAKARHTALLAAVPVFEMPQQEDKQRLDFKKKFSKQAEKAGVKFKQANFLAPQKSKQIPGLKVLRLQGRADECKFDQLAELLAGLNDNPYLIGVDELQLKCDPKNHEKMSLTLTVSTFAH